METMRDLGAIVFASRLKLIGDRLKCDATRLYREHGIEFNDGWFLVAFALSKQEEISVTEVSEAFGVSHAAVSQMVTAMKRRGLIVARSDERDRRRAKLRLSSEGQSVIESLRPIWHAIGECTRELIESTGLDCLSAISAIEEQLEQRNLYTRVTDRMKQNDN